MRESIRQLTRVVTTYDHPRPAIPAEPGACWRTYPYGRFNQVQSQSRLTARSPTTRIRAIILWAVNEGQLGPIPGPKETNRSVRHQGRSGLRAVAINRSPAAL
jgi:hypothetical protein